MPITDIADETNPSTLICINHKMHGVEKTTMRNCGLGGLDVLNKDGVKSSKIYVFTIFICEMCKYTELYSGEF